MIVVNYSSSLCCSFHYFVCLSYLLCLDSPLVFYPTFLAPKVTDVEVLQGLIVRWAPLSSACVSIIEYHIQFRVEGEASGSFFRTVLNNKTVYEVNMTKDLPLTGQPINVFVSHVVRQMFVDSNYAVKKCTYVCVCQKN